MSGFGIRFSGEIRGAAEVPAGFCPSKISLGNYEEFCLSDCSKWNPENYVEHWKISAKGLLNDNMPKLFCSSLEEVNTDLWIGIPQQDYVIFYNRLSKSSNLIFEDLLIYPKVSFSKFIGNPSPEWSRWEVPLADLKCFSHEK